MKNNFKNLLVSFLGTMLLVNCSDFLEKYPLDEMNDQNYFTKETDLKYYMNGVYDGIIRNMGYGRWFDLNDANDDWVTNSPSATLMQHSNAGLAGETNGSWDGAYAYIRKINYFLHNAYRIQNMTKVGKHYLGEGYYCRASKYFDLLQTFGGVPYIDEALNTDSKELYRPRDSREYIAKKILADLDSAIFYCDWQGEGEAKAARINKECALIMKTRVALYEGTWEYYHGRKNTPFAVKGSDGKIFLAEVEDAAVELIQKHGDGLFRGSVGNEYFDLFNRRDYEKIPGVFLYKVYSVELGITQNGDGIIACGTGAGLTKNAVDAYLMKDGKPKEISSLHMDDESMNELCAKKDPRLGQTIWCPSKGRFTDYWPSGLVDIYKTSYPGLIQNQQRWPSYSGYRIWKGSAFDLVNEGKTSDTDDVILRYAEALLNYAEAKAILGTISQEDLDHSVNYIRARVDMPPMQLAEVNGWNISYLSKDGYDPLAPNIINEIRRERRIEFMLEGLRSMDIKRWALLDDIFNGWKPLGAWAQEYVDYWNDADKILADGFDWKSPELVRLIKGNNYDDMGGYINPFFKHADFKDFSARGYYVNPARDYLNFIPREEIIHYKDKAGVILEQNPGWF